MKIVFGAHLCKAKTLSMKVATILRISSFGVVRGVIARIPKSDPRGGGVYWEESLHFRKETQKK